jgi:hypothetical protein
VPEARRDLWIVDGDGRASSDRSRVPGMTRAFAAAAADMLLDHGPLTLEELQLLGAAADRVQLASWRYERYEPYDAPFTSEGGDVVRLDAWGR